MSNQKKRVPAIEGWFEADSKEPHLLGSQCTSCGSYFFPKESFYCKNPDCEGGEFKEVPLSRTGKLWSVTNNCYKPPPPYVSPDPFKPYGIAAVELDREKLVILGQLVPDVNIGELKAGMNMEMIVDTLFEDEGHEYLVWKWKPAGA